MILDSSRYAFAMVGDKFKNDLMEYDEMNTK